MPTLAMTIFADRDVKSGRDLKTDCCMVNDRVHTSEIGVHDTRDAGIAAQTREEELQVVID